MAKITYQNKADINTSTTPVQNKVGADDMNEIKSVVNDNDDIVGDLTNLTTTDKTSIVDSINEIDGRFVYSTTEKVIGKWIDGKTLYGVVIDISSITLSSGNTNVATFSSNNVVKKLYATFGNDTNQYTIPNKNSEFNHIGNNIVFSASSPWGTNRLTIIIEYTKTTD